MLPPNRRILTAGIFAAILALPVPTYAAGCSSISAPAISFGSMLVPGTANIVTLTFMTVACASGTVFQIALGDGLHPAGIGAAARRNIANGGNLIPYTIYSNAARTTQWGDGMTAGTTVSATGTGAPQRFPMYTLINIPSNAVAGTYSDSVTLTIEF
jgi:spore coat protein U-like protein